MLLSLTEFMETVLSFVHPENASFPILLTCLPITALVASLLFLKAEAETDVTV